MTGQHLPPETRAAILTHHAAGQTTPQIAQLLGCAPTTVKRYLRAAGVKPRDDRTGQGPTHLTNQVHALGTTTRHIRAWATTQGLAPPPTGPLPQTIIDAYTQAQEGTT